MRRAFTARWLAGFALLAVGFVVLYVWASRSPPTLTVCFLDVGQGDCAVVQTPGGHVLVVDSGGASETDDQGRRTLLPYLRSKGIRRIDALLLTHPDADHIGGASTVLRRMDVRKLLINDVPAVDPIFRQVLSTARERGVEIVKVARGMRLEFDDSVTAEVVGPPAGRKPLWQHPDNNASLVVRLSFGSTRFLLTGDAEAEAEQELLSSGVDLRADVLKVGHHGSKTSTTDAFLARVNPQAAVVSAGRANRFGHPHPDVVARVAERRMSIFRTDRDGAITCESDGKQIAISTHRVKTDKAVARGIY